ncbi:MAG: hypothetical protein AB3X44_16330 [Leptothrix sp. (in: b-proteobacteria)]
MHDDLRARIVEEAYSWMNPPTPYHHHARLKGIGVDCAQILIGVFEACGVVANVDPGNYAHDWHLHHSEELYANHLDLYGVRTTEPQAGDVALYKFGRTYSHGAIVVNNNLDVIHSYIGRGVILSRPHEDPLDGRPVLYWSINKVGE